MKLTLQVRYMKCPTLEPLNVFDVQCWVNWLQHQRVDYRQPNVHTAEKARKIQPTLFIRSIKYANLKS